MIMRIPFDRASETGLRPIASRGVMNKVMTILAGKARVRRTMWSRRAQEYTNKIQSGDVIAIGEVVRELWRDPAQPEQSFSERQMYQHALSRLAREYGAVYKISEEAAVVRLEAVMQKSPKTAPQTRRSKKIRSQKIKKPTVRVEFLSADLSAALHAQIGQVRHWAFDLDDTLYEPKSGVFRDVRNRIAQYVENRLELNPAEAKTLRDQYHKKYGATLGGLIAHHGIVAEEYLGMVHAVSLETLTPCAERRKLLAALPGKRHIFTNSSVAHAERVLRQLNLLDLVDCIFDVAATNWRPKPQQVAYDGFLKAYRRHAR